MYKFMKRAAVLLLCLVMLLQIVGCGKKNQQANTGAPGAQAGADSGTASAASTMDQYGTVWSAPSTVKIDRDDVSYANKGAAELTYNAVKNEYESRQLLISATADINSFYLEAGDLTCGSNVLSKDNITVYYEKYVTVSETSYGSYTHPDALIPIDTAKEYGELKIAKDQNGAFWVTVYVPAETPAGVYEGAFKLTAGSAAMDIPVKVTVNDYVLPETTSGQSLFSWRYDRVGAGELDSSIAMMETYYEFFLDYRTSLQSLPIESTTREEITDALLKYYDTLSTYTICPIPGEVSGGGLIGNKEYSKEMILAVASISGPEKNYFEKAMIYAVDEPNLTLEDSRNYAIHMVGQVDAFLAECVAEIEADTTGQYDSFKSVEGWQDSILNIPNIMPLVADSAAWLINGQNTAEAQEFLAAINTICPIFDIFNDQYGEKLLALCEQYGVENIWWYGCTGPRAPYGNYHIGDKELIRARAYSWIQAKFGIEGNLYWDAAAYTDEAPLYYNQYINVYEYPFRGSHTAWPAGDGFLAYPGAAYGIYGPLPSMRLMSIRDGMEELEMLLALETQYEAMAEDYGEEFSAQESIANLVDTLSYNGSAIYADGSNGLDFDALRASLIDSLVWNEQGVGFVLAETSVQGTQAEVSYYVAEGCETYIDDQAQKPVKGRKYKHTLNLEESPSLTVTIETADGQQYEVSRFISYPTKFLQTFEDASVLDGITVSEGGSAELAATEGYVTEGSSVHLQVVGKITGDILEDATYVPTVSFNTAIFEGITNLTEVDLMNMDIYNPGESFKVQFKIYAQNSFVSAGEYLLDNGKNSIAIQISGVSFSAMANADRIVIEFANSADGVTPNQYELYIDNIIASE